MPLMVAWFPQPVSKVVLAMAIAAAMDSSVETRAAQSSEASRLSTRLWIARVTSAPAYTPIRFWSAKDTLLGESALIQCVCKHWDSTNRKEVSQAVAKSWHL